MNYIKPVSSSFASAQDGTPSVPRTVVGSLRDSFLLHISIILIALVFRLFHLSSRRFRNATDSFDSVYQFRSGRSVRRLIFSNNRITTRHGPCASPDFEIHFIDLPGALAYIAKYPNDPITLIMENKIVQIGNLYYLYRFGYYCGLCESIIGNLGRRRSVVAGITRSKGTK